MHSDPHFDGRKCIPYDFIKDSIRVPIGVRLFGIAGKPFVVPGTSYSTRVYVHPDDIEIIRDANK